MVSSKILFFFFLVSITSMAVSTAEEPLLLYKYCAAEEKGNSNSNSTVQKTYNQNLKTLSTAQIDNGFYNSSSSEGNSSSIGLCRPDIPAETCRGCLKNVTESLWNACPSSKVAIGGEDNCMFRYSNRSILGEMETGPYFWVYNLNNVTDVDGFNKSRTTLLRRLAGEASGEGDSRYKYAMGQIGPPNSQNIYAMVQCTPDLTKMECSSCLNQAIDLVPKCCNERQGGRVIMPSCNFRYEIDLFYDPISPAPAPEFLGIPSPAPEFLTVPSPAPEPDSHAPETAKKLPISPAPEFLPIPSPAPKPVSGAPETGKISGVAAILIMGSFLLLP